jgi:hypothetical protein
MDKEKASIILILERAAKREKLLRQRVVRCPMSHSNSSPAG